MASGESHQIEFLEVMAKAYLAELKRDLDKHKNECAKLRSAWCDYLFLKGSGLPSKRMEHSLRRERNEARRAFRACERRYLDGTLRVRNMRRWASVVECGPLKPVDERTYTPGVSPEDQYWPPYTTYVPRTREVLIEK